MRIGGLNKLTLIDYPGKVACLVFVTGCNFSCPFCHNAHLVDSQKGKRVKPLVEKEVWQFLKKRVKFLDGVVITGGEPTLQSDLADFLKAVKKLGLATMIETNGSQPEVLAALLKAKLLDFVAMDYKTIFADYEKVVRQSSRPPVDLGKKVNQSLRLIVKSGLPFELRTTVVPTIHTQALLLKMARELKKNASKANWVLQTFRPQNCLEPKFNQLKPFDEAQMEKVLNKVKKIIPTARLR